jgi:hypothetical protein
MEEIMELWKKLDPQGRGFSPLLTAIVGAIIGHDYGARDGRGGIIGHISITSDGFIQAHTTSHETGAFLGDVRDMERNLELLLTDAKLTVDEMNEWDNLYRRNVTDWRHVSGVKVNTPRNPIHVSD